MAKTITNALTIDVEDYYHATSLEIKFSDWDDYESRVDASTRKLLDTLGEYDIKATFFLLGWVAERHPKLLKEIQSAGHEIGSHSYAHRAIYEQTPEEFAADLRKSLDVIEGIIKEKVLGFRAPSFSITKDSLWAIDIMREGGLKYDCSVYPIAGHDIYGIPNAPRHPYKIKDDFWEFPMTTVKFSGRNFPVGGGAYLRVFPYWLTKLGIQKVNSEGHPAIVYLHPWEIDPEHPKIESSLLTKFRHYFNLHKTEDRLKALFRDFKFAPIRDVLNVEN